MTQGLSQIMGRMEPLALLCACGGRQPLNARPIAALCGPSSRRSRSAGLPGRPVSINHAACITFFIFLFASCLSVCMPKKPGPNNTERRVLFRILFRILFRFFLNYCQHVLSYKPPISLNCSARRKTPGIFHDTGCSVSLCCGCRS